MQAGACPALSSQACLSPVITVCPLCTSCTGRPRSSSLRQQGCHQPAGEGTPRLQPTQCCWRKWELPAGLVLPTACMSARASMGGEPALLPPRSAVAGLSVSWALLLSCWNRGAAAQGAGVCRGDSPERWDHPDPAGVPLAAARASQPLSLTWPRLPQNKWAWLLSARGWWWLQLQALDSVSGGDVDVATLLPAGRCLFRL